MLKYTILYKNGKTWNGKAAHIDDLDLVVSDIVHITVKHSGGYTVLYSAHGPWYDKESLRIEQVHLTRHTSIPKVRTPNPNSKTKKQKAFEEDYEKWAATRRPEVYIWGSGHAEYSIQAYKKWLWVQKCAAKSKEDIQLLFGTTHITRPVDKDGFIPWNGGDCPVQHNIKVDVRFREDAQCGSKANAGVYCWKHYGSRSDIVAYKVVEENLEASEPSQAWWKDPSLGNFKVALYTSNTPIKTTYTFWLGVNGEIVDDK